MSIKLALVMLLMSALLLLVIEAKNQDEASSSVQRHKVKHQHKKDAKHEYYLRKHLDETSETKTLEAASGANKEEVKLQLDGDKIDKLGGEVSSEQIKMQGLTNNVLQNDGKVEPEVKAKSPNGEPEEKKKSKKMKESELSQETVEEEVPQKKSSKKKVDVVDSPAEEKAAKRVKKVEPKVADQKPIGDKKKSTKGKENQQKVKKSQKKNNNKKGHKNDKRKKNEKKNNTKDKKSKHSKTVKLGKQ